MRIFFYLLIEKLSCELFIHLVIVKCHHTVSTCPAAKAVDLVASFFAGRTVYCPAAVEKAFVL